MCGTRGYLAPEIQGVLPRRFKTGEKYSFALDLWSLGCVVHELLTSQIPFVEIDNGCDETDDMTGLESGFTGIDAEVDMESLCEYCRGEIDFPSDLLRASQVINEGIQFVKSLLVANPRDRATAASALQNPWLKRGYTSRWYHNLYYELSWLSISLDDKATSTAIRQLRTVDIATLIPAGTDLGELLQQALARGFDTVSLMLFKSPTRQLADPLSNSGLLRRLVSRGRIEFLRKMAPIGIYVNWPRSDLLAVAVDGGRLDMVQLLLDSGADITARSRHGEAPLQMAARGGHVALAQLLLGAGADVNAEPGYWTGQTALHAAAKRGYIEVLKVLLDNGADTKVPYRGDQIGLKNPPEDGDINQSLLLLGRGPIPRWSQ